MTRVLVTGGAGFVGSNFCKSYKERNPSWDVVAFDNLRRRGSEINLPDFAKRGIKFVHGDIRHLSDLHDIGGRFDLMIEASAEPSVHAGIGGGTDYLFDTNLSGTRNALEYARASCDSVVFLSTSRVYSIEPLRNLPFQETATRLNYVAPHPVQGVSALGIREDFETSKPRSFYGASKLASEMLIQEYVFHHKIKAIVNRCGVIAGPGQFGKVDQGVFTLWVARHLWNGTLSYTGFGGKGLQVRDLLHPRDLFDLVDLQVSQLPKHSGQVFNVGGGANDGSVSLLELTRLCEEATGNCLSIRGVPETNPVDIPWYISDFSRAQAAFGWSPKIKVSKIIREISEWLRTNESSLKPLFS